MCDFFFFFFSPQDPHDAPRASVHVFLYKPFEIVGFLSRAHKLSCVPQKISTNKTAGLVWKQMVSLQLLFCCICVKWGNSQLLLIEVYKREPPLQGIWLASQFVFDVVLQACHGQTGSDRSCPRWNDFWAEIQWKQSSVMVMIRGIEDLVGNASCLCLSHVEDMACVEWHLRVSVLMFDLWSLKRCWGGNKQDLSFTTDVACSDPEALLPRGRFLFPDPFPFICYMIWSLMSLPLLQ